MILPIVAYGDPVLKKDSEDISKDYPALDQLIENMFETMYHAKGVGLAAPQIGLNIRLFIVDGSPFADEEGEEPDPRAAGIESFKKVFINPVIEEESGEIWSFQEGCLSIPKVRENVPRKSDVLVSYYDADFFLAILFLTSWSLLLDYLLYSVTCWQFRVKVKILSTVFSY